MALGNGGHVAVLRFWRFHEVPILRPARVGGRGRWLWSEQRTSGHRGGALSQSDVVAIFIERRDTISPGTLRRRATRAEESVRLGVYEPIQRRGYSTFPQGEGENSRCSSVERLTHVSPRRVWFEPAADDEGNPLPKYCPSGHRFHDPLVWTSAGLACHHKGKNGESDCSHVVLLIGGDLKDIRGRPRNLMTTCTREEMREMECKRMSLDQMLEYLGLDRASAA